MEKRISRIQECYKLGQRVLKECEPYSAKEELERVAAKIGIKPEQAARYRAMAMQKKLVTPSETLQTQSKHFAPKGVP